MIYDGGVFEGERIYKGKRPTVSEALHNYDAIEAELVNVQEFLSQSNLNDQYEQWKKVQEIREELEK